MNDNVFVIIVLGICVVGMACELATGLIPDTLTLSSLVVLLVMRWFWKTRRYFYYVSGFLLPWAVGLIQMSVPSNEARIGLGLLKLSAACGVALGWQRIGLSLVFLYLTVAVLISIPWVCNTFTSIPGSPIFLLSLLLTLGCFKLWNKRQHAQPDHPQPSVRQPVVSPPKGSSVAMNFLQYCVADVVLMMLYTIVASPLILLAEWLKTQEELHTVSIIVTFLIALWFFFSMWITHQTTKRMVFEGMTLTKATVAAYYEFRLNLAFLPVVGKYFEPPSDDEHTRDR